ncbi:host cell division inhibitor Icd-like protein [Pantoea sp. JZ2]|nr:host cell division inhibitor Icd-like protein [Pantoea sp. JZ2]WRH11566.1 host cell division inhibitor Icd-like protein [Pantoea sp. JZ2]
MPDKTKATLQGRPSHFLNSAENNSTLIDQVNARRFAHIFSGCGKSTAVNGPTLLTEPKKCASSIRPKLDASSSSLISWFYSASSAPSKAKGGVSTFGSTPKELSRTLISSTDFISDEPIQLSLSESVLSFYLIGGKDRLPQNKVIEEIRDFSIYAPERSDCYSCEVSLVFLRWRRLISFLAAAIKKPAVLSSGSLTASINSRSASGSLTETCSDLLFLLPVAIAESPYAWWCSVCLRKILNQALTWCSPVNILVVFTSFGEVDKNNEARQCANTYRASYHNVIEAYIMAVQQHTQTHPKFTWRFLAIDRADMASKPCRLSVEAETEQDARRVLAPHFILSLAARLPLTEVRHA